MADANNLIVVAPQAVGSVENQIGCWDTYGLTGPLYGNYLIVSQIASVKMEV